MILLIVCILLFIFIIFSDYIWGAVVVVCLIPIAFVAGIIAFVVGIIEILDRICTFISNLFKRD